MKQNIDFFTHDTDSHQHPKHELLIATYGYEGYGRFWALNEMIGKAENARLDLGVKRNRSKVANVLKMTLQELDEFVEFLSSDDCELVDKSVDYVLTTDRTQHDLGYAMNTREAARNRKNAGSIENDGDSGELSESSAEQFHEGREGREGREGNEEKEGEEDAPTREASSSPQFLPWLLTFLRTEREMRNPEQFARKVTRNPGKYPDLLEEFELSRSPDAKSRASPKQCCPHCGKQTLFVTDSAGVTRCPVCNKLIGEFEDDVPFTAEG